MTACNEATSGLGFVKSRFGPVNRMCEPISWRPGKHTWVAQRLIPPENQLQELEYAATF